METGKIDPRFIVDLRGKSYCTYAGALDAATRAGLKSLTTDIVQLPSKENGQLAVITATAIFDDGRVFTDLGDASPAGTSTQMASALCRLAATRAKGRVLKDGLNIGEALLEEALPDAEEVRVTPQRPAYQPPPAAPVQPDTRRQESAHNAAPRDSSGDERANLLQQYAAAQKRARELGLKFQILRVMNASNVEIAEATLALRGQISETESTIAARPAV